MSYKSGDSRVALREKIGTEKYVNGEDIYCIIATDKYDDNVNIPMYLPGECRTEDMPPLPFIEINLVSVNAEPHNIGGNIRKTTAYLDMNIYYANTDNIEATTFGKTVADEIIDCVTQNRSSVTDTYFVEVINDGREIPEYKDGKIVAFHRVLELKATNYDNG